MEYNKSSRLDILNDSNISYGQIFSEYDASVSFFDTYFSEPRFAVETSLAISSAVINFLALISSTNARKKSFSTYHTLFINLCIANILNSCLSWLSNNMLFLFHDRIMRLILAENGLCQVFVYLTAALFVCTGFSVVSILTLLGFITVQYFAICQPLTHIVYKKWVIIFIFMSWVITLLLSCIPFLVLLVMTKQGVCDAERLGTIFRVVMIGVDCCISVVAVIYMSVLIICLRIYFEVCKLQKRLSQFRYTQELRPEQRAFVTTLLLMASLTIFFIPYTTVYVVSLHNSEGDHINNSGLIYYMNILPYVKFLSDPLIYGLRMKEIREGCARFAISCGCQMYCVGIAETNSLSRATSVTGSIRARKSFDKDPNVHLHLNLPQEHIQLQTISPVAV